MGQSARRILGGTDDTEDPAVVWLTYGCTGTIVDSTHVLTAAHCAKGSKTKPVSTCPTNPVDSDPPPSCLLEVTSAVTDPQYDGDISHDVGILTLKEPTSIAPKALPTGLLPDSAKDSPVRFVGYGDTNDNSRAGDGVKRQAMSMISKITSDNLYTEGSPQECDDDSGAPIFWPPGTNETVVGVVSAGDTCRSASGGESIFARVDNDVDWIKSQGVVPVPPGSGSGPGSGVDGGVSDTDGGGSGSQPPNNYTGGAGSPASPSGTPGGMAGSGGGCSVAAAGRAQMPVGRASFILLLLTVLPFVRRRRGR